MAATTTATLHMCGQDMLYNVTELRLSLKELTSVPAEIFWLTNLTTLDRLSCSVRHHAHVHEGYIWGFGFIKAACKVRCVRFVVVVCNPFVAQSVWCHHSHGALYETHHELPATRDGMCAGVH
eukprot:TRINITY_DN646_c1_g2_i1.p3 TRINITY_DN646_c1_g2~~TRINITY_DN646_c1_g2_i1.p3  ORF type:complete len:123 (-),score=15.93 TRINITY_DN646_c1_g2_i1:428-796(-)